MKGIFFLCYYLGFSILGMTQTLDKFTYLKDRFHQEEYLNFSFMLANIDNPAAPNNRALHKQRVPFIDLYFLKPDFSKGGLNRRSDYKLIPDMFWLFKQITEKDEKKLNANQGSSITGGIIGWHHWSWNIIAKPQHCIGLGINLSDYFIGSIYQGENNNIVLHEPQGWQIGIGPVLTMSNRINNTFVLISSAAYVPSLLKPVDVSYAKADDAYTKPHFLHGNITLMSKWGVFLEGQYVQLINLGNLPNQTRRLDLKLGFAFVL